MTTTTSSIVPLTTQFIPSTSCLKDYYTLTTMIFLTEPIGYLQLGPSANSDCQPSGWDSTSQYFSPGVCPSGYAIACSTAIGAETQATCCPISWSCQVSSNWPQYGTDACTVDGSKLPGPSLTITNINGTSTTTIAVPPSDVGGLNAYGVSIRWKEADFATTTSTLGSATPSTSPTTSAAAATSSTPPIVVTSAGLSTGVKAGIGIGAAIGALAILGALFFWLRRHRRRHATQPMVEPVNVQYQHHGVYYGPAKNLSPVLVPPVYHEVDGEAINRVEAGGASRSELS